MTGLFSALCILQNCSFFFCTSGMNWQLKKKKKTNQPKPNKFTLGILQTVPLLGADSMLRELLLPAHVTTSYKYIYLFSLPSFLPQQSCWVQPRVWLRKAGFPQLEKLHLFRCFFFFFFVLNLSLCIKRNEIKSC